MDSLILAQAMDFGYTWPWTHGHLVVALGFTVIAAIVRYGFRLVWPARLLAVGAVWAVAAFFVVHYAFRIDLPLELPTPHFLAQGGGRVLDVGSGSGRASLMVLAARPGARLVALDDWSADYIAGNSPDRLRANARAAGVEARLEVKSADMRRLPFDTAHFDAVVSTYAIDHLPRGDILQALEEVNRVLRPGGDFLLMVMHGDGWARFVYGPFAAHHGYGGNAESWDDRLLEAGFDVLEAGRRPATAYFLARKRAPVG